MRLLTWNVNRRIGVISDQIKAMVEIVPDIIALQEVSIKTCPIFRQNLSDEGYSYFIDSFSLAKEPADLKGPRRYGEFIACRWPLESLSQFPIPWPERVLSVAIQNSKGKFHLHTTHIPPGVSNGWIKIETLEGIYEFLARMSSIPRILCGDFNTPQRETLEGHVITWGKLGSRWDLGERNVLEDLGRYDLPDVFRYCNGYQVQDFSWYTRTKVGRRFDHIFASKELLTQARCWYAHGVREQHLSDHSAMVADLFLA